MPENRKKILIVDGQTVFGMELGLILRNLGYDACGQAYTWDQALGLMKTLRPDLVVADVQLVKSDKAEALIQLAQTSGEVPIVYHTSHTSHSSKPEKSMAKMLEVVEMLIGRDGDSFRPSCNVLAEKSARPLNPAVL